MSISESARVHRCRQIAVKKEAVYGIITWCVLLFETWLLCKGMLTMKKKIALFSSGWSSEILVAYGYGAVKAFNAINADLYIFTCYPTYIDEPEIKQGELNIFTLPDLSDFDGALILGNSLDFEGVFEDIVDRCHKADIPVVVTGRKHEYAYYVGSENYTGAYNLALHLLEEHHVKRPFFVAGMMDNPDSNTRLQALKDALSHKGRTLPEEDIFESRWEPSLAYNKIFDMYGNGNDIPVSESFFAMAPSMARMIISPDFAGCDNEGDEMKVRHGDLSKLPDAIICANDGLAMMAAKSLEQCGVKVPEDVIVTGFDNGYYAQIYSPSISSVNQRFYDIGILSAKTLIDIWDGKVCEKEQTIDSRFVPSESCGCKPGSDYEEERRNLGKNKYQDHVAMSLYTTEVMNYDSCLINGCAYEDIKSGIKSAYERLHVYLGDSFHLVLEPAYEKSINNPNKKFNIKGYSPVMDAVFSVDKGTVSTEHDFDSRKIIPGIHDPQNEENRQYIILPLHEREFNLGYVVYCDDISKLNDYNRILTFAKRLATTLSGFRQNLCLARLNKRLLELTETDALTHVMNRTAFDAKEKEYNVKIRVSEDCEFAVAMFDVNNLKKINDEYGHDAGDEYIIGCCHLVCKTFKCSPVYRIGGDEFVVVLDGEDYLNCDVLLAGLRKKVDELSRSDIPEFKRFSVASGIAKYDPKTDKSEEDVFRRADELMYENKAFMKGEGNIRR